MKYQRLNRSDLKAWDTTMWGIIADAQSEGWLFGMSSKGHAIGRSPDGTTTISVPSKDVRRSGKNARAELTRWRLERRLGEEDLQKVEESARRLADPLFGYTDEEVRTKGEEILDQFKRANADDAEEVGDGVLVVMRNMLSERERLSRLLTYMQAYGRAPEVVMVDLDFPVQGVSKNSKAWRVQWALYDAVDYHVVDFGGPKMTDELAAELVAEVIAEKARRKQDTCTDCGKTFKDTRAMKAHARIAHAAPVICPVCGKSFTALTIKRHQPGCTPPELPGPAKEVQVAPRSTPSTVAEVEKRERRPDAVEAIMDLLTEVEELRSLRLTETASEVVALREQVATLTENLSVARDEADHWRKQAEDAEGTLTKMRQTLGISVG